jgi:hypothetical protein
MNKETSNNLAFALWEAQGECTSDEALELLKQAEKLCKEATRLDRERRQ